MRVAFALLALATAASADLLKAMHRQRERSAALDNIARAEAPSRGGYKRQDGSSISFANPAANEFFVDGTKIPDGMSDAACPYEALSDRPYSTVRRWRFLGWFDAHFWRSQRDTKTLFLVLAH